MNSKMPWKHRIVILFCVLVSFSITAAECNNPTLSEPGEDTRDQEELEGDFEEGAENIQMSDAELEEFCDDYQEDQQGYIDQYADALAPISDRPYISLRKGIEAGLNKLYTENC